MDGVSVEGVRPGRVLLVGEAMALFGACEEGDLSGVRGFVASTAGAELNVAVGLKRLGQEPMYMTRLGCDPFADRILGFMRANGLDVSLVARDESRPTGFMLKSRVSHGDPVTFYRRAGSAASAISPMDVGAVDWRGVSVLHLTGILPPLSQTALEASYALVGAARGHGVFVSFDPNLRPALWPDADTMRDTLRELASQADLVLPGLAEGRELFGAETPETVARAFLDNGAKMVVVKDGPRGALAATGDAMSYVPGFVVDRVVDTVGCGDGFAAGVLSALLEGQDLVRAAERGCALGAIQTQHESDNEGLPTPSELAAFTASHQRAA